MSVLRRQLTKTCGDVPQGIRTPVTAVKGRRCHLRPFALWSIAPLHLGPRNTLDPTDCASDGIRGLCKTIRSLKIPFLESRPPRISSGRRIGACKAECAAKSPRRLYTHRGEVVEPAFAGRALPMRIRRQSWPQRPTSGTLACSFFSPLSVIGFRSFEAKRRAAKVKCGHGSTGGPIA